MPSLLHSCALEAISASEIFCCFTTTSPRIQEMKEALAKESDTLGHTLNFFKQPG